MHHLSIDLETYSSVPIAKAGAQKYISSPDFEILLFAYSLDGAPVEIVDLATGEQLPPWLVNSLTSPEYIKHAYNAPFEWGCLSKFVGYLPPEQGTPKADELPTFYAAVVQDTAIPGDLATDTGIALANMTLAAWDKGVGSCIMGAINKPALTALLGIKEPQKLAFMVAFGYPTHKASIVPMTEQTGVKYYLDENRDYCVPKRSAEEIARSV